MRRAAGVLLATVVVAGCGGQKRAREVPARLAAPPGCHVSIFFATRMVTGRQATPAEIAAVRARLASSSRIKTFAFVSRRLALRRVAKRFPALVQGAPGNPLPPAYEVVLRSDEDTKRLVAEFRRARGVEHVSAAKAC
jgi:cell division protein FtsX